jgi:hypothetical protein
MAALDHLEPLRHGHMVPVRYDRLAAGVDAGPKDDGRYGQDEQKSKDFHSISPHSREERPSDRSRLAKTQRTFGNEDTFSFHILRLIQPHGLFKFQTCLKFEQPTQACLKSYEQTFRA